MNHRDTALAAMRGQRVDHIPFIARMDLWYNYHHNQGTLPHPYERASLWDIQRDLGIGIFGFGIWGLTFYRYEHRGVEVVTSESGGTTLTEYRTPHGTLTCRDSMADELEDAAVASARTEFPFKSPADYGALQYLFDHTRLAPNFDAYGRLVDDIGAQGVALPSYGHLPAHQLMLQYMGYEEFYVELHENEARVLGLIDSLTEQFRKMLALAAICPAGAIEIGGNYDEQMTPPPIFDRFFAPLYREARAALDRAGKTLVIHGDGEMKTLLERIRDCGVHVVEAVTPAPMTSIDVRRTRELWKDRVALWGGIPSIILTPVFTDAQFEQSLEDLFRAVAPGDRFILGFGDNVPTDALPWRIVRVAEFWREKGRYPLAG